MTREDAIQQIKECEGVEVCNMRLSIIDTIFDDFESRTCDKCQHYMGTRELLRGFSDNKIVRGCSDADELYVRVVPLDKDYGCTHFQRKFND